MSARINASFQILGVGDRTIPVTFPSAPVSLDGLQSAQIDMVIGPNPLARVVTFSQFTISLTGPSANKVTVSMGEDFIQLDPNGTYTTFVNVEAIEPLLEGDSVSVTIQAEEDPAS